MDGYRELILCLDRALEETERNVKEGTYDANTVMSAVNKVRCLCRCKTDHIRSASLLLGCADRLDAVFTACLETLKKTKNDVCGDVIAYCDKCVETVATGISVCRRIIRPDKEVHDDIDTAIVTADIEGLVYRSRDIRISVVSMHRRIFSALSELECIDAACDALNRCLRLIEGCSVFAMIASFSDGEEIVLL